MPPALCAALAWALWWVACFAVPAPHGVRMFGAVVLGAAVSMLVYLSAWSSGGSSSEVRP